MLLKNRDHLLPLDAKALHSVALIGKAEYATKAVAGCCNGSSDVLPLYTVTPLDGVKRVLASLGSTATVTLTVVAKDNGNLADAVASARSADVAVVLAGTLADEGRDRPDIALADEQDAMISAVAAANPRTVVVLKDNASVLLPWIDQVPAVLETWFPGQEDGDIMARLLFGVVTPSGKLPVTFPTACSRPAGEYAPTVAGSESAGQRGAGGSQRQRIHLGRVFRGTADGVSLVRRAWHRAAISVWLWPVVHDVPAFTSRCNSAGVGRHAPDRGPVHRGEHRAQTRRRGATGVPGAAGFDRRATQATGGVR